MRLPFIHNDVNSFTSFFTLEFHFERWICFD